MKRIEKLKSKSSQAPVYSRTEKEKEPLNINWLKLILVFLFLGGAGYLLFFSDFFKIKNIEVSGYSHPEIVQGIATEMTEKTLLSNNIFLFNLRQLENTLSGDSKIEDVRVRRIFPSSIVIEVVEAQASIIWESRGERFLVDRRGVVSAPAKEEEILPVVFDASNIKVSPGERVASPTFIKFINDISQSFEASTGTKITKITILDILTDVHVLSSNGFIVYMDATKTAESQLKNLTRVLEEAKKSKTKLDYIDLRLDNKIFYK